ncbi:hypothetical protein Q3G72_015757 [Acer saccharum]|nr:hypothetical protein Q3G72_015757 [Acer saccharum]
MLIQDSERDTLQAASAAEKLIKEKELKAIIGMERWGEATLVADIGNRVQVPVLSLAEPAITPPLMPVRWPFLWLAVAVLAVVFSGLLCSAVLGFVFFGLFLLLLWLTYDAVIGNVTIRASQSKFVEFIQPYAGSRLSMIVPTKSEESAWMFLRPFTLTMWVVTGAFLIYTMLIVWLLEHKQNPEFNGPWKNQIGTALWFTFSSLFFAQRERIYSNLTRVAVVVWLFVVLILNSSYTASLSSMLTVKRLKPSVTDIQCLQVFQKGSPIAADFSEAILKLSENGVLKSLEERWFAPSPECSANAANLVPSPECLANAANDKTESLTLSSFWGLYLISGATSTICFILFIVRLLRNYRHGRQDTSQSNIAASMRSIWSEVVRLVKYICNREGMQNPGRVLTFAGPQDVNERSSSRWESSEADVEMLYLPGCS